MSYDMYTILCSTRCGSILIQTGPVEVTSGRLVLPPVWAEGKPVIQVLTLAKAALMNVWWGEL